MGHTNDVSTAERSVQTDRKDRQTGDNDKREKKMGYGKSSPDHGISNLGFAGWRSSGASCCVPHLHCSLEQLPTWPSSVAPSVSRTPARPTATLLSIFVFFSSLARPMFFFLTTCLRWLRYNRKSKVEMVFLYTTIGCRAGLFPRVLSGLNCS